jgi:hypothetical protein
VARRRPCRFDRPERGIDRVVVEHVDVRRSHGAARRADLRGHLAQPGRVDVPRRHSEADLGTANRRRPADAARRAGHDGDRSLLETPRRHIHGWGSCHPHAADQAVVVDWIQASYIRE